MLERAAVLKIGCNPGRAKSVAAGGVGQGGRLGPPLDHVKNVAARDRVIGQLIALFKAPKQRSLFLITDAGGCDPGV